jgi:ketosteroid isomerase-like protein
MRSTPFTLWQQSDENKSVAVQTLEVTRKLSEIDRELLRERLKSMLFHMDKGDIDGMLEHIAPDVVCFPRNSWGHAHYPRQVVGREAMREAFRQRYINYVVTYSVIHKMLIDGDDVAVHRTATLQERGSSVSHTFDCILMVRFRAGLVIEFCVLPDGSAYDAVTNFPH